MGKLSRSWIVTLSGILKISFILIASATAGEARKVQNKPSILFIMADDLGQHQLGCYGSQFYETPHLDRLATEGMKFNNAYAACTVCSPTRASIMTGKYPARLHLTDYIPGKAPQDRKLITPQWTKHLKVSEVTIAEKLKQAGYATGHFGKWHLNRDKKYSPGRAGDPQSQGFDDVLTTHKPKAGPPSKYTDDWHHVKEITERAITFIERNRSRPFFCYVSHNSIHSPEIENKGLVDKYSNKPNATKRGRNNPVQAAMLETLDNSVGQLLKKIKKLKLDTETIVIFYSDNGQLGPKQGKPFRGSKGDLYEGGIRMPLIIRWPGVIAKNTQCNEVVISNDFFLTFAQVAGVPNSQDIATDGVSLLPLLSNPQAHIGRKAIFWHFPHYHGTGLGPQGAVRMGKYKLIEWFEKSIAQLPGAFELYDLSSDPAEQNDLATSLPEITQQLSNKLKKWRTEVNAQMMSPRK